ncbi:MAG: hypothetical protein JXK07_13635 [Spirochaetes bacterium]|nr:hypothetical protein [Spirochaetota bacterium]MBN2771913.1 hypothetical protein [Spirochaetota bacterium]
MEIIKTICMAIIFCSFVSCGKVSTSSSVSGSMAQMILDDDILYYLASGELHVFDVTTPSELQSKGRLVLNPLIDRESNYDTLSIYEDLLLVGMNDSIMILDKSDSGNMPVAIARISHNIARDPIIGHNGYLYSTIRTEMGGSSSQDRLTVYKLDIDRFTDKPLISEVAFKSFFNPHGLLFYDDLLLIADGKWGLKGFTILDGVPDEQVFIDKEINAYDLISADGELFVSSEKKIIRGGIGNNKIDVYGEVEVKGDEYVDGLKQISNNKYKAKILFSRFMDILKKIGLLLLIVIGVIFSLSLGLLVVSSPFFLIWFLYKRYILK